MAITFQADATAPACAINVYCSGGALSTQTTQIVEAESGGSGNTTALTAGVNKGATEVCVNLELPVPAGATWAAGTWTVKINVVTANSSLSISAIYICRVSSACASQASIGSATGLAISLGSTGVKSQNVTGSSQTPSAGDKVIVVIVVKNSAAHAVNSFAFDSSQGNTEVLSPFTVPTPVTVTGAENPSESGAIKASARPTGAEQVSEASSAKYSQASRGAEHPSEAASVKYSQAPKGAGSVAEAGAAKVSQAPKGAEGVAAAASAKVSQAPKGSEALQEAASAVYSQAPKGAGRLAESGVAVTSEKPSGAERLAEASSMTTTTKAAGSELVSETGAAKLSQAPRGAEAVREAASMITSQAPRGSEAIAEASATIFSQALKALGTVREAGSSVFSQATKGSERLSELVSVVVSESPKGQARITATYALVVSGGKVSGSEALQELSSVVASNRVSGSEGVRVAASLVVKPPKKRADPVSTLELSGGVSMAVVAVTVAAGSISGFNFADGLLRIKQVLAAYITGDTANSLVAQPVVDGNKVTVTLAGSAGATVQVLVEGY